MTGKADLSDERDEEYESEMNQMEEEDLANRPDYLADDHGDDFASYDRPRRGSRADLTPRSSPSVPPSRASGVSSGVSSSDSPDFESFDPSAYVRNRRSGATGRPIPERDPYQRSPRRRRELDPELNDDTGVPIGAVGGLGGLGRWLSPETMPVIGGFANELGPLFRWVLYGFGCLLFFALIGCGAI